MVEVMCVRVDTKFGFSGLFYCLVQYNQHDCLDTCCFECPICMCFAFLYLPLFSATEHVSHGKAL